MKTAKLIFFSLVIASLALSACTAAAATPAATPAAALPTATSAPVVLKVMTHDSFAASDPVIAKFEKDNNVKLEFIKGGDAGSALNRAILTKGNPEADVFYGVDNTFLSRALDADIYQPYASPLLKDIPAALQLDPSNRALPVDYGDVCINFDKAYFQSKNLPVPQTLEDLFKPEYTGMLVVENPATSSPGLAFLLATIAHFGPENYIGYWKQLRANGLVVVNDWNTAYYTNFSGSSGKGAQPMVVSYGTSPAAEVVFSKTPITVAPTASIVGPDACFRQVEFVGILKGTKQLDLAQKFVDYMLGATFQEDMPLQMFVFPANQTAKLPNEFKQYIQVPDKPAALDPAEIAKNRDVWIENWNQAVFK